MTSWKYNLELWKRSAGLNTDDFDIRVISPHQCHTRIYYWQMVKLIYSLINSYALIPVLIIFHTWKAWGWLLVILNAFYLSILILPITPLPTPSLASNTPSYHHNLTARITGNFWFKTWAIHWSRVLTPIHLSQIQALLRTFVRICKLPCVFFLPSCYPVPWLSVQLACY